MIEPPSTTLSHSHPLVKSCLTQDEHEARGCFFRGGCQRKFTTKSTKDTKNGILFKLQHPQPVEYKGVRLDCSYSVDLLVEEKLIIELKSVEQIKGTLPQGDTFPRASTRRSC